MTAGNSKIRIRVIQPDEAAIVSGLALRSKAYWGYDAAFMQACAAELTVTPATIQEQPAYLIEADGRLCGFYILEPLSKEEIELTFLFVEPEAMGQGHGSRLLQHTRLLAARLGYRSMLIVSDPNAEKFYLARGAGFMGSRPSRSIPGRELPVLRIDLSYEDI